MFLDGSYQYRPLIVVAASPDPFGREVPVLSDWLGLSAGADAQVARLRLGARLPFAVRLSGTGSDGVASTHADDAVRATVGDPELAASFPFAAWGWQGGVVQRLTLPFGAEGSFVAHAGPRYAPGVSLARDFAGTLLAIELGVRLRRAERFGDVRFGSEVTAQAGVSQRLGRGFSVALEGLFHPALQRDETRDASGATVRVRRLPLELLASVQLASAHERLSVGVGTSLPLSERTAEGPPETFAGPPGAPLTLAVRAEHGF